VKRRLKPYYNFYNDAVKEIKRRESIIIPQILLKNKSKITGFKDLPVNIQKRILKNSLKWSDFMEIDKKSKPKKTSSKFRD
jgi:hypothetical protein